MMIQMSTDYSNFSIEASCQLKKKPPQLMLPLFNTLTQHVSLFA